MRKNGFTLAEAMVTLGIIGVISAISIPSLINEYNKQVYTKSLQVAISDFENAMGVMMMKEGVFSLVETEAWKHVRVKGDNYILRPGKSDSEDLKGFVSAISKTLLIEEVDLNEKQLASYKMKYQGNEGSDGNYQVRTYTKKFGYFFAAGFPKENYGKKDDDAVMFLYIDVNGKRPPNYEGRDVFWYKVLNNGTLDPRVNIYNSPSRGELINSNPLFLKPATRENLREMCAKYKTTYCSYYLWKNGYKMDY